MDTDAGFTLLEATLSMAVSAVLLAALLIAYRMHLTSAEVVKAKTMLATIREGIQASRFRTGAWPVVGTTLATPSLAANTDDLGDAFWPQAGKLASGANLAFVDPFYHSSTITDLGAGQLLPATYGGWLYDATPSTSATFSFMFYGDPGRFPGDPPSGW